jgi:hypothetical protein
MGRPHSASPTYTLLTATLPLHIRSPMSHTFLALVDVPEVARHTLNDEKESEVIRLLSASAMWISLALFIRYQWQLVEDWLHRVLEKASIANSRV